MLRPRFLDAAHARRTVFEQLLESLQALACGQFLRLGSGHGTLRLDPLIALGRHQRRDRHQPIAAAHACTRRGA